MSRITDTFFGHHFRTIIVFWRIIHDAQMFLSLNWSHFWNIMNFILNLTLLYFVFYTKRSSVIWHKTEFSDQLFLFFHLLAKERTTQWCVQWQIISALTANPFGISAKTSTNELRCICLTCVWNIRTYSNLIILLSKISKTCIRLDGTMTTISNQSRSQINIYKRKLLVSVCMLQATIDIIIEPHMVILYVWPSWLIVT